MRRFVFSLFVALGATTAHAAVDIQEFTTPAGIDVWMVEENSIPFTALEIRIRGGASLDLPGKRGATNLMMALIEEGAGDLDAQAFQTRREALAASFGFRAFDDTISISAEFLTENRDEAVALLKSALNKPRFDQFALDRVRAQVIAGIASDAKNPNRIASAAFNKAAFGDHPYGSSQDGTEESVNALTRDDIIAAHQNALTRDRMFVSAVGDISADDLATLVDDLLGGLPAEGPELPQDVEFGLGAGLTVIDYETPQSVALFGHKGIERDDDDFFAAYIINQVLGAGGFESRLMTEVREKRGLTYGIGTYLIPKFHAEMYLGSVASSNETIAEAIEVTKAEWARMSDGGLTEEELATAKTFLTGEYPLRFDGNAEIASILVGMQMIGLPSDYVINRNDFINAVTIEEIARVAGELLDADALHFVVVGQPVGLGGPE